MWVLHDEVSACLAEQGFGQAGVVPLARRDFLTADFERFALWLSAGAHADMEFLERNHEARLDPGRVLPAARTALVVLADMPDPVAPAARPDSLFARGLIARYARGKDYHKVLPERLERVGRHLRARFCPELSWRAVVDSVPFFDRAFAREGGLGFVGRNTMLITPGAGSFRFIATLLLSAGPEQIARPAPPRRLAGGCGGCRRCLAGCPTGALVAAKFLDSRKCLSYLSIEHRGLVPREFLSHFRNTIFGCDICQTVCPYNGEERPAPEWPRAAELAALWGTITAFDVACMSRREYEAWFGGTAVTRAKYAGLIRNALYHLYAMGDERLGDALEHGNTSEEPLVRAVVEQIRGFDDLRVATVPAL